MTVSAPSPGSRRHRLLAALLAAVLLPLSSAALGQETESDRLYRLAIAAFDSGDMESASRLIDQAVTEKPKDSKLLLTRGYIRQFQHQHQQAVADFSQVIELDPNAEDALQRRGEEYFKLAEFDKSVADFERVIELQPQRKPYHWQLGISYYYAKRFQKGTDLFELHRNVNSNDVENSVWHFLCAAQVRGIEEAQKGLIPVTRDPRLPMMAIWSLFSGDGTEEEVWGKANQSQPSERAESRSVFYAYLYLGLYWDALGDTGKSIEFLKKAAKDYRDHGYMGQVARIHYRQLKQQSTTEEAKVGDASSGK